MECVDPLQLLQFKTLIVGHGSPTLHPTVVWFVLFNDIWSQ